MTNNSEMMVEYVKDDNSSAAYTERLAKLRDRMGFVPNSMGFYYHRPAIADAILQLVGSVGHDPDSTLERSLKRKLALVCSSANGCVYCTAHQCSFLTKPPSIGEEGWGLPEEEVNGLISGTWKSSDPVEQVCIEFALIASKTPGEVPETLRAKMRKLLSSPQIIELASVVGMWKCLNTVHDSLQLPLEDHLEQHASRFDLREKLRG